MPSTQYIITLAADVRTVAWVEDDGSFDPNKLPTIAVFDRAVRSISRTTLSVPTAVYQIAFKDDSIILATGLGVFNAPRKFDGSVSKLAPENATVDQLGVVGDYVIYRNYDPGQTVAAIDSRSGARATLGSNATTGPFVANGRAMWYEHPTGSEPAKIASVHV